MEYQIDDKQLDASVFLSLVNQVWPNDYDVKQTEKALAATMNITAYDGEKLVGCLRILTDGYFFGTITELLILPAYQKRGSVDIGQAGQHLVCRCCCRIRAGQFSGKFDDSSDRRGHWR